MTQSEFDEVFAAGKLCIRADNMEQWFQINDYAQQRLGCETSCVYPFHDCASYPFVFCVDMIVDASMEQNGSPMLPFDEFCAIVHEEENEEGELPCITLAEIL